MTDEPRETALPWPRRVLYLSAPYVLLLAALLAAEAAVRLAWPRADSLDLLVAAPLTRAGLTDQQHVRIFEGDPLLLWKLKPNVDHVIWNLTLVSTNAQGLRYPHDVGPKPDGTFRIVALGDSVTFGFRVPRVLPKHPTDFNPAWQPYPARLEAALRAANPGRAIEVIPLAVPGYSSHQGRIWLERDVAWLRPDVVIACFGWNDISDRGKTDRETMSPAPFAVATRRLLSSSQLVSHLGAWLRTFAPPGEIRYQTMRVPRDEYVANMLAIAAAARNAGAVPVFIGPVYRDRFAHPPEGDFIHAHRDALRTAAAQHQIAYLEVPELTEDAYPDNAHLWEEHIHPNHKGHELLAERLLRFLAARQLLGDLRVPADSTDKSFAATPAPATAP